MVRTILLALTYLFISLFMHSALALNAVTATVDKNPAMLNESVILTVIADDNVNRNALDTSPLLQDFIVGRVSVSSQTNIINFKTTRTTRWQIVLIPRKSGIINIPALSIEDKSTSPIALTVLSTSSAQAKQQQELFITTELSEKEIYVQQLLTLTVKLHFSAELKRGSLTEPNLPGATIEQIGQDKENDSIINGKRYRVIERTYAITPQQSGEFTLIAPMFSGEVMVQSQRRSNFLSFGETKPVSVVGEEIAVTVLPIPDAYPQQVQWLPSEIITLHQEWQPNINEFKVGEPITRTILLTAAGLSKEQLPKLTMKTPAGIKVYPDQAELNSTLAQERLVSQLRQNFALVASHPGTFELPEIKISWWNTVTNRYQQASLPAQTITVQPSDSMQEDGPTTNQQAPSNMSNQQDLAEINATTNPAQNTSETPVVIIEQSKLQWVFLALWLITLLAWLLHIIWLKKVGTISSSPENTILKANKTNNHSAQQYYLALLAACKNNDAQSAINLILPWLNSTYENNIATLDQATTQVASPLFSHAVDQLQQYLYGKNSGNAWQGNELFTAVTQLNKQQKSSNSTVAIQLNP